MLGIWWVLLFLLIIVVLLLVIFSIAMTHKWRVRDDVPRERISNIDEYDFSRFETGDLLYVFGQGHLLLSTGHLAIVIKSPTYGQLYVWDVPNPFFFAKPTVLKMLRSYVRSCFKLGPINMGQKPRLYVQHLITQSEEVRTRIFDTIAPIIRNLAKHAKMSRPMMFQHLKYVLEYCVTSPAKKQQKNKIKKKKNKEQEDGNVYKPHQDLTRRSQQQHTCTSSVLGLMVKAGVLDKSILTDVKKYNGAEWVDTNENQNTYPHMFLHENWTIDDYVLDKDKHFYSPLVEIVLIKS